jgi:L-malate glycosyltransferase
MNICFFTENHYKGGLDTFIINLINAWPSNNDNLTLICNESHPGFETIKNKISRVTKFKKYSRLFTSRISQGQSTLKYGQSYFVRIFFVLAFRLLQYPILFPWYVLSLALYFRRSNFDRLMVINGGYPASLLCRCAIISWRLSGKKSLATLNFHNSAIKPPWYFSFPEYLIDMAVNWSVGYVVTVSKNCLNTLKSKRGFLNNNKLRYIYNGVADPARNINNENTVTIKSDSIKPYCLMLATYEERKGHEYLLRAFKIVVEKIPESFLRIYGYGRDKEKKQIINTIKKFNLEKNVSLKDFEPDVSSLLANASLLVVPSQAYESFGLTIIEAMAFSLPVVATDVGGMPEVLEGSNAGFVCSKNDPIFFANSIINILSDSNLASELGRNGRLTFEERFNALNMSNQYKSIIKE